jgi:hypothetical protein
MTMKKLSKIDFDHSKEILKGHEGSIEGLDKFDYRFMVVDKLTSLTIRTRSEKGWMRDAFLDQEKRTLHILSYDPRGKVYLLESAVPVGSGYERREASMSVEEIKAASDGGPGSIEDIVGLLSESLEYSSEGFEYRPTPKLERIGSPLDPDDPLSKGRGAQFLNEAQRDALRNLMAQDPVERDDLPKGMMTTLS